jgi:acyl-CoA reductase-like NAD-dependent aldehyde dehydrogenase
MPAVCDMIQFTGSTATGKKVAMACAERLIPCSLELGGKDPAIVLADADLDRAANGITWGAFFNSGQVCVSIERVYVEAPVYDEFMSKLAANVRKLQQGSESDSGFTYDLGAMATEAQRDLVQTHIDEAVSAGAKVLTGGKPTGQGTFFQPTVLTDVTQDMTCIAEETFGPTLPVVKVADEEEAIRAEVDWEIARGYISPAQGLQRLRPELSVRDAQAIIDRNKATTSAAPTTDPDPQEPAHAND